MASIKPIIRTDKIKSNGEAPIYVRFILDRKPKYKSLGRSIDPKYWDEHKEKVKSSHPNSLLFNNWLQTKLQEVVKVALENDSDSEGSSDVFRSLRAKSHGLLAYSEHYLKTRSKSNKPGMVKRMNTIVSKIRDYLEGRDIPLSSVNYKWLTNYDHHLRNVLKNSTNTVASNMSGLRTILNAASRENLIKPGENPFDLYKIRREETEIVFLTDDELEAFKSVQLNDGTRIQQHQRLYLFACYSAGIRIGDLLRLKWKHFDGERLTFKTSKTGVQLSIKLGPTALQILNKMKPATMRDNDEFIFNLLPANIDTTDEEALLWKISSATAYANKNLQKIAKKAGIEKHLHFHTSRHTWATRMLRRGMRIEHVSKLLGHKSIRETQKYAKIVNADLDQAIDLYND